MSTPTSATAATFAAHAAASASAFASDPSQGRRIYIGNLPADVKETTVMAAFGPFGKILRCDMKTGFAFAEYTTMEEAKAASDTMDGKTLEGRRLIVEIAKGSKSTARSRRASGRGQFRINIAGLDPKTSWQDLKDFARSAAAGPISFTDVWMEHGQKYGVVEYLTQTDLEVAIRKLDGTLLDGARVSMKDAAQESSKSSRSRSRDHTRSGRSRSPGRSSRSGRGGSRSRSHGRRDRYYSRRSSRSRTRSRSRGSGRRSIRRRSRSLSRGHRKISPPIATTAVAPASAARPALSAAAAAAAVAPGVPRLSAATMATGAAAAPPTMVTAPTVPMVSYPFLPPMFNPQIMEQFTAFCAFQEHQKAHEAKLKQEAEAKAKAAAAVQSPLVNPQLFLQQFQEWQKQQPLKMAAAVLTAPPQPPILFNPTMPPPPPIPVAASARSI